MKSDCTWYEKGDPLVACTPMIMDVLGGPGQGQAGRRSGQRGGHEGEARRRGPCAAPAAGRTPSESLSAALDRATSS